MLGVLCARLISETDGLIRCACLRSEQQRFSNSESGEVNITMGNKVRLVLESASRGLGLLTLQDNM